MKNSTSRPTLVLIHAFPLNSAMWEPQREALAEHAEIITPDLPGFGNEPRLDGEEFSMALAAQFIGHELDARNIGRCVIGGLSMGGYVAFQCWRLFGERITGLILADTKASADTEETRNGRYKAVERIGAGEYDAYIDETIEKLLSANTRRERPQAEQAVRKIIRSSQPESLAPPLLGMAGRPDSTPLLPTIDVPTALIFGEDDAITSVEEGRKMAETIPDARLTIVKNAGHLSNIENPEEFNAAVMNLLQRVAAKV